MTDPWQFQRWAFGTSTGNPVRKAVLVALATMADTNTGRCEAKQDTLATWCEVTDRAVRGHLKALQEAGLVARRPQFRFDGRRRGDEILLLAPWVDEWPDGQPARNLVPVVAGTDALGSPEPRSAQEQPLVNNHVSDGRGGARPRADEVPDDFPDDLRPHARVVMRVLRDVAQRAGAREVRARAVGLVLMAHPRHELVREAYALASWADGQPRPIRDVVATYRNWLGKRGPMARTEVLPGEDAPGDPVGVTRLRPNASSGERLQQRSERRRAQLAQMGALPEPGA